VKTDEEVFKEFCETIYKGMIDPLEYIAFRDSVEFQSFLAQYRLRELMEAVVDSVQPLMDAIKRVGTEVVEVFRRTLGNIEFERYFVTEVQNPRKKKRGTKRRKRQGRL
jgi:hypothetical protein